MPWMNAPVYFVSASATKKKVLRNWLQVWHPFVLCLAVMVFQQWSGDNLLKYFFK
jgi:hypothetical protein